MDGINGTSNALMDKNGNDYEEDLRAEMIK
jgi:hypothetical protein